jgi:hypothetical protein
LLKEDADIVLLSDAWHADVRVHALERLARAPVRAPRALRIAALALLLALHAAIFALWYANRFPPPKSKPTVVQVRLIDESVPPPPATPPHARATAVPLAVAPSPMAAALLPAKPPRPVLFNRDGSVRLPFAPRFESPLDAGIARGRELLARGHNLIHCRRSKFDNSPTDAQAATTAARGAHMAHLVMGNPLDPLNDVGEQQAEDAVGERAAEKRRIEEQACDY